MHFAQEEKGIGGSGEKVEGEAGAGSNPSSLLTGSMTLGVKWEHCRHLKTYVAMKLKKIN